MQRLASTEVFGWKPSMVVNGSHPDAGQRDPSRRCGCTPGNRLEDWTGIAVLLQPRHFMYAVYAYIILHWGVFGGQCRHISHTWSIWVILL